MDKVKYHDYQNYKTPPRTWNEICDDAEHIDYWVDEMVCDWNMKKWTIPKLPVPNDKSALLKKAFPYLNHKQLNEIIKEINKSRRACKKDFKD